MRYIDSHSKDIPSAPTDATPIVGIMQIVGNPFLMAHPDHYPTHHVPSRELQANAYPPPHPPLTPLSPPFPSPPAMDLKPRHHLPLRITQRPLTPRPPRPHPVNLLPRETPRLNRSIIPQPAPPRSRLLHPNLITHPSIRPFIHRHHDRPPKAQIMLQRYPRPRHQPIRRPPPKLPHQLRTLRQTARTQGMSL